MFQPLQLLHCLVDITISPRAGPAPTPVLWSTTFGSLQDKTTRQDLQEIIQAGNTLTTPSLSGPVARLMATCTVVHSLTLHACVITAAMQSVELSVFACLHCT